MIDLYNLIRKGLFMKFVMMILAMLSFGLLTGCFDLFDMDYDQNYMPAERMSPTAAYEESKSSDESGYDQYSANDDGYSSPRRHEAPSSSEEVPFAATRKPGAENVGQL